MLQKYTGKFYCFSPPVMIATFAIELIGAMYTLLRYKMTAPARIITAILTLLAVFQLAEYNVCATSLGSPAFWSRIGFVAIAILPPLGIHLVSSLTGKKWRTIVILSYLGAFTFAFLISLSRDSFASHVCGGNYAIFQLTEKLGGAFFTYYYALLFLAIGMCLFFSLKATLKIRQALIFQTFGYLCFLLPTGVTNAMNPQTISGIPSVMCGFAVIYALTLVFGIMPTIGIKRS